MIDDIVRHALGRELRSVVGTFHVHQGHVSKEPIAVWLGFGNETAYRFGGASDGWHLVVDAAGPQEVDMGESGAIQVRDLRAESPFSEVMNEAAQHACLLWSPNREDIIGACFGFPSSLVYILNWGDEMYVGENLPSDASLREIGKREIR